MRYWAWILLSLYSLTGLASPTNFDATYVVRAFGADIGESRHRLHCSTHGDCELSSQTRPIGLARIFTNERLQERSRFSLKPAPQWHYYEKKKYAGDKLVRTVTLIRQAAHILYVQGPRRFPLHVNVFDALSLPFVLHRWATPPDALYLQDNNWQDQLTAIRWHAPTQLEGRDARHYRLEGQYVKVDIWLDEDTKHIPLKVQVYNRDTDKTITLTLKQEAQTDHALE